MISSHWVRERRAARIRSGVWHFEQVAVNVCSPGSLAGSWRPPTAAVETTASADAATITHATATMRRDRAGCLCAVMMTWSVTGCTLSIRSMKKLTTFLHVSAVLLVLSFPAAAAQLQIGALGGTVIDANRQPIGAARVVLQDSAHAAVASVVTLVDGSFEIRDVVPGSYVLRVDVNGTTVLTQPIVVRGALPVQLTLSVSPAVHEEVVVRGDAAANAVERPWSLSGDTLRRVSESLPSQRVQSTLASLPGWMAEDNGLLHVRGVDDGLLFVQDGIPVYERLD